MSSYHGWTHAPKAQGGTDPIPGLSDELPWARRSRGYDAADQSIPHNSITNLSPNHDYNMGAGESGEAYFVASSNGIEILQDGVYAITFGVDWNVTLNFPWALMITGDVHAFSPTQPGYYEATGATISASQLSYVHRYPAGWLIIGSIFQYSGVSKNLNAGFLEIVRLGGYSGTPFGGSLMNPDA